jgi:hypothetical protein
MTTTRGLWAIVLLAVALRVFPVWFGLPYPYARPDEAQAISGAVGVLAGDPNPHFFHWPSLTFYVFALALGVVAGVRDLMGALETLPRDVAVVTARTVVALAGSLTVIPLFRLARRFGGDGAGLVAAACLAVAPLHVRDSHFAMTDVLMTLFLTISLACLVAAFDRARVPGRAPSIRDFVLAGFVGGLAASTKYNAAAVVVAIAAAQLLLMDRRAGLRWQVATPLAAFLVALIAGFAAGTPFAVFDAPAFAADFVYDLTHLSAGHAVDVGRGWAAHAVSSLPLGCGPLLLTAGIAGVIVGARKYPRHTLIVGAFAGAYYAVIGSGHTAFFRYVMPLVPIVCLFAAVAVHGAAVWLSGDAGSARRGSEPAMAALLAVIVATPSAWTSVRLDVLLARTDTRVIAGRWLASQLTPDHSVYDAGTDYTKLDLREERYHEWFFNPATQSFGHPAGLTPDWIVIGDSPLSHYAGVDDGVRRLVADRYDLAFTVQGAKPQSAADAYDRQDAFFLPFSGLGEVERPGPTITVYRRRD